MAASPKGVGEAMWEECVVDPASGQPLSGSFMDYGMPRSNSLPYFTPRIVEFLHSHPTPSASNSAIRKLRDPVPEAVPMTFRIMFPPGRNGRLPPSFS